VESLACAVASHIASANVSCLEKSTCLGMLWFVPWHKQPYLGVLSGGTLLLLPLLLLQLLPVKIFGNVVLSAIQ